MQDLVSLEVLRTAGKTNNRPVALRGHVTNASFKRCVGILLTPKIDEHIKIILHPKFERKGI